MVAACAVLPGGFPTEILGDSKALSERRRNAADSLLRAEACFGIGIVGHEDIDRLNILRASLLAMSLAYDEMAGRLPEWAERRGIALPGGFPHSLVSAVADGTFCPEIPCRAEPKADARYPEVMAASILAKVRRDAIMTEMDALYPGYGYAAHKGYPTAAHLAAIRALGPSPIQRLSFRADGKGGRRKKKKAEDAPTLF